MKRILIDKNQNSYKANLHCHSVLSDGSWTVEQIKEEYKKRGYSIVAFTDHDILIPHQDLRDDEFLPLNGFEAEFDQTECQTVYGDVKCCHLCFIALEEDNIIQPCWHRSKYQMANAIKNKIYVKFDENEPDFVREFNPECITKMIKTCREKGFFVTYNHPTWSREDFNDYINYFGMHAMEMTNSSSLAAGYDEYNSRVYDDMLRYGKRIYCIGADDNHNREGARDSFIAYTVIKANCLEYREITKALEQGNFYTSQGIDSYGPEIKELYYEDGRVHISCSDAQRIFCTCGSRSARIIEQKDDPITEADFEFTGKEKYFRITVADKSGFKADTNAYFFDDLNK